MAGIPYSRTENDTLVGSETLIHSPDSHHLLYYPGDAVMFKPTTKYLHSPLPECNVFSFYTHTHRQQYVRLQSIYVYKTGYLDHFDFCLFVLIALYLAEPTNRQDDAGAVSASYEIRHERYWVHPV